MESILKVNHLIKTFGSIHAVNDISFQVHKGAFFGFLGVNGAGKSTTINMLCTLFPPTSGQVHVCGHLLGKEDDAIRRKIGVLFQGNTLDGRLTIKENLIFRSYLYESSSKKVKQNLKDICDILEIGDLLNRKFKDLSGGQKRRCELARALIHKPNILFLDEPTTGLDPKTRQLVWECIDALRKDLDMTLFLTTHYMEEAAMAQQICVIDHGKIIADDSPFKLKERYASDVLRLEVNNQKKAISLLEASSLDYKCTSNRIEVSLPNTLAAISLLNQLEKELITFEVIQGTMEDAFLNLTAQSKKEVMTYANSMDAHKAKYENLYA